MSDREQFEIILQPIGVKDYEESTQVVFKVGSQFFNISDWCENLEQAHFMEKCFRQALAKIGESQQAKIDALELDAKRLNFIQTKFTGMSNSERYLPFQIYWGDKSKTLRQVIDEAIKKDTK